MMDVTADLHKTKVTIELDAEDAHILLEAMNYYLGYADFAAVKNHEQVMKELEDRLLKELQ